MLRSVCELTEDGASLLKTAMERLGLSARAYDSILKVARTIADHDAQTNNLIPTRTLFPDLFVYFRPLL